MGRKDVNWVLLDSELKFLFPVAPLDNKGARHTMLDEFLFGPAGDGTTACFYDKFKRGELMHTDEYNQFANIICDLLDLIALRRKNDELSERTADWWRDFLNTGTIETVNGENQLVTPLDLLGIECGMKRIRAMLREKIRPNS